jgi:predicted dehydrogenase
MPDDIRIGVIGLGSRGIYLADSFNKQRGARVTALCDRNEKRFDMALERMGDATVPCYTASAALLAEADVDAIVVATHDKAHAANGCEVLAAGKHLFMEKPMAQTVDDCDALIRAWQSTESVFMIGLELRHCSVCEDMKAIVDRGDIGRVHLGYAVDNVSVGGQYFFHDALRRKDFVGNLLLQKGTHTIDIMNWLIDSQPTRVYAEGGTDVFGGRAANDKRCGDCDEAATCPYFMEHTFTWDYGETTSRGDDFCVYAEEVDIEDNTMVTVRYESGAKMTYLECHFTPDYNRHFTLIGDKGRLYGFYNNEQEFQIEVTYRHSKRKDIIHSEKRVGGHGGSDPRIQAEFIRLVQEGASCCPGIIGARNSAAIGWAAGKASEDGMPVALPPAPLPYAPEFA